MNVLLISRKLNTCKCFLIDNRGAVFGGGELPGQRRATINFDRQAKTPLLWTWWMARRGRRQILGFIFKWLHISFFLFFLLFSFFRRRNSLLLKQNSSRSPASEIWIVHEPRVQNTRRFTENKPLRRYYIQRFMNTIFNDARFSLFCKAPWTFLSWIQKPTNFSK